MNLYTVNEAIWLAAASYTYAQFKIKDKVCVTDFYMKAAELANNAKTFTTNDVQLARIHQHCNGDHANCSNKFLRRIEETAGNPVFRVTATGEFGGDKERPDGMDPASELEIEGLTFTIGDLISFVEGDYKQIVSGQALYKLYTIEEIRNRLVEIGFNIRNVASDMVQIGDKRTTIHRTADRGIILYATEEDFENITEDIGLKENIYVSNARSKEMIQDLLDKEQGNIEKVLCFPDGNRILHPSSAANYNADEIIMYSAGNFRKVFKILTGYEFMGNKTDIDYLGILEYLKNNRELPYAKPERPELTDEQRDKFLEIKKNGQEIVAELKKIYERCKEEYGLEKCEKVAWDDASHTKTRKYLWVPMKYDKYGDRRESISVFVEMLAADKAVFRVSLEFKNDSAKADEYQAYHRHLELPIDEEAGLVYVAGSNELGRPERLSETQDVVKEKVESKEYDKVQICKYIDTDKYPTNEDIEEGILEAVEALLPYYEYVIGAGEGKRAWLLTWNPDNWNWEDYEEACVSTKHGEITIIPWTCKNKQPQVNDDVFLIKTGVQPRGIIAHGRVSKEHYEAPHYDEEKAAAGVMAGHIDAEYDWIQHYENEEILLQDDLKELFPEQQWSPMGSGIEIRSEYVTDLKKMWNALIEKKELPVYFKE